MSLADIASQINSKVAAAIAAQESGDYATALTYLRSAKMLLAGIPNVAQESSSLQWDRTAIDSMITDLKQLAAAGSSSTVTASQRRGIRRTNITYKRAGGCD
jgi:DNA-binding transcriptional regulator LsrR (DeoR family)